MSKILSGIGLRVSGTLGAMLCVVTTCLRYVFKPADDGYPKTHDKTPDNTPEKPHRDQQ